MDTARTYLALTGNNAVYLEGNDRPDAVGVQRLCIEGGGLNETLDVAEGELQISKTFLKTLSPDGVIKRFHFAVPSDTMVTIEAGLLFPVGKNSFLGKNFTVDAGYSAGVILRLVSNAQFHLEASASILLQAQLEVNVTTSPAAIAASAQICVELNFERLFAENGFNGLPSLELGLPDFGFSLPKLRIPWSFPKLPDFPFKLPGGNFPNSPIQITWKSAQIHEHNGVISLDLIGLCLKGSSSLLEGDLRLVWKDNGIDVTESYFDLYRPDVSNRSRLQFDQWHHDEGCLLVGWKKGHFNNWLKLLLPELEVVVDAETDIKLRVLRNEELLEVRVDCIPSAGKDFKLPGVKVSIPNGTQYSLVYRRDEKYDEIIFAATIDMGLTISAKTAFAFDRDSDRELNNGESELNSPLIKVDATSTEKVSVAVATYSFRDKKLLFFRQLARPLGHLVLADFPEQEESILPTLPDECPPSAIELGSLSENWLVKILFPESLKLPLLQSEDQSIVLKINAPTITLPVIRCDIDASVNIGRSLKVETKIESSFNLETMAFKVDDNIGIDFKVTEPPKEAEFLGLKWKLLPAPDKTIFKLVTLDKNYQIRQAPGSIFSVTYDKLGTKDKPLTFELRHFVISSKGISVKGRVSSGPIRLGGLNTQFQFTQGEFTIEENKIRDFSIAGSGALPPDLVGEATADISLQFRLDNGKLEIVSGIARLRGNNLLDCKSTRFQFKVDGLGLKFVNDGCYHFYFTITGMAKFVSLAGDDASGPLAWLPGIEMQLMECPLTGDVSVLSKHIKFLVEMPKKPTFSFLGCFKMELRGIGFVPQAPMFDGDGAMILAGQLMFADAAGDVIDVKIDLHNLYIGLPKPGEFLPRIHFKGLGVKVRAGEAFALEGEVDFFDSEEIEPGIIAKGFGGRGALTIQGLPTFDAVFTFVRVSRVGVDNFVRAWFLYVQVGRISIRIPLFNVFIREIGLGFGYRYTLASIKTVDELTDPRQLIKTLTKLSLTQGELSRRDQWRVDLENPGEDPRWTIVARMMIAQNSAAQGITDWNERAEKDVASIFLLDVVLGIRSDLTIMMTARAWLNTNYNDYLTKEQLRTRPLLSGFVFLSPRQKRFLAHFASNPGAEFGDHPPLPGFLKEAIKASQFSATLLIEPGLFHYELGWPNQLQWKDTLGPITAEFRGGVIFRISTTDIVYGNSLQARGSLRLEAQAGGSSVGARISATAQVAYGARYIGVIGLVRPIERSALYGAVGIDINVVFSVQFWLRFKIGFVKINITLGFEFSIQITALVEVGITPQAGIGASGRATVQMRIMGRDLHFKIHVGVIQNAVDRARDITNQYLNIGLEATEAEPISGTENTAKKVAVVPDTSARGLVEFATMESLRFTSVSIEKRKLKEVPEPPELIVFKTPAYAIYCIRRETESYFLLYPAETADDKDDPDKRQGFLPVPPVNEVDKTLTDFEWTIPWTNADIKFSHFNSEKNQFEEFVPEDDKFGWPVNWKAAMGTFDPLESSANDKQGNVTLRTLLRQGYITNRPAEGISDDQEYFDSLIPLEDPIAITAADSNVEDHRVYNPSDKAYEAAVKGTSEQFEGSPYFKRDENSLYEANLANAFLETTSVYAQDGQMTVSEIDADHDKVQSHALRSEQAIHMRSLVISQMITDFQKYVDDPRTDISKSVAFQMGLVFKTTGGIPEWLRKGEDAGTIRQRNTPASVQPSDSPYVNVSLFNKEGFDFASQVPQFQRITHFTDADTIAINWELKWSGMDDDLPHYLNHYLIRRRALDGAEAEVERKVKPIEVLNRPSVKGIMTVSAQGDIISCKQGGLNVFSTRADLFIEVDGEAINVERKDIIEVKPKSIQIAGISEYNRKKHGVRNFTGTIAIYSNEVRRIKPRFQFTDNFNNESPEDKAALTIDGKSYLYTIVPVDINGNLSPRPLTLVATRRANHPPHVPADGELEVSYVISEKDFPKASEDIQDDPSIDNVPTVLDPTIKLKWTKLPDTPGQPKVGIEKYFLVFRKEKAISIGSYGIDAESEGNRNSGLPSSNARKLRTDLVVELELGNVNDSFCEVKLEKLKINGIFPDQKWRPEAWRIFLQTVSYGGVASTLAPVKTIIRFERNPAELNPDQAKLKKFFDRQPELLEWIPKPVRRKVVVPEDEVADVDIAAYPMPLLWKKIPDDPLNLPFEELVRFRAHPEEHRTIRLRWNQSPSKYRNYPARLNAGFKIFEFDLDAHVTRTINEPGEDFFEKLRLIQDVELLPKSSLNLTPGDNNVANLWEAWYPSTRRRLQKKLEDAENPSISFLPKSSEAKLSPWFSWRESYLEWPRHDGRSFFCSVSIDRKTSIVTIKDKVWDKRRFSPGTFVIINGVLLVKEVQLVDGVPLVKEVLLVNGASLINGLKQIDTIDRDNNPDSVVPDNQLKFVTGSFIKDPNETNPEPVTIDGFITLDVVLPEVSNRVITESMTIDESLTTIIGPAEFDFGIVTDELVKIIDPIHPENNGIRKVDSSDPSQSKNQLKLTGAKFASQVTKVVFSIERIPPSPYHPLLHRMLLELDTDLIRVEINPLPDVKRNDLKSIMQGTSPQQDPYGWNILKTLGLAVSFTLRDRRTGEVKSPGEVQAAVKDVIKKLSDEGTLNSDMKAHLFIELLFKPSRATQLNKDVNTDPVEDDLLSLVQVSLRPVARQFFKYQAYRIRRKTSDPVTTDKENIRVKFVTNEVISSATVVDVTTQRPAIEVKKDDTIEFLLRSGDEIIVAVRTPDLLRTPELPDEENILIEPLGTEVINENERFAIDPSHWLTLVFDQPVDKWRDLFVMGSKWTEHWQQFSTYLLRANSSQDSKLELPDLASGEGFPQMLTWLSRLMDFSGDRRDGGGGASHTEGNITLASAYPLVFSPAALSPDDAGRLTYNHRIEDRWGHMYRYYFTVRHRYDKLWQLLATSDDLFPNSKPPLQLFIEPEKDSGGLDVVLDRIKDISPPHILFSGRLDPTFDTAVVASPGKTWEVIIAKHPEQIMIERNLTLFRHLDYRQLSHTVVRKFAFEEALKQLNEILNEEIRIKPKETPPTQHVDLPGLLPLVHMPVDKLDTLSPDDRAALDLPRRLGSFAEEAVVLQWTALPYFYQHRMLAVAQTSKKVSAPASVVQSEFEYVSPKPKAEFEAIDVDTTRILQVRIALAKYWDCLPLEVKNQWQSEMYEDIPLQNGKMELSAIPDTEVVYNVGLVGFGGYSEAISEIFFQRRKESRNQGSPPKYTLRQISESIKLQVSNVIQQLKIHDNTTERLKHYQLITNLTLELKLKLPNPREIVTEGGVLETTDAEIIFNVNELTKKLFFDSVPIYFPRMQPIIQFVSSPAAQRYMLGSILGVAEVLNESPIEPEGLASKVSYFKFENKILLCAKAVMSMEEQEILSALHGDSQAALNRMFLDLENRAVFNDYFANWSSEEPITSRHHFEAIERIDFPAPSSCVLVLDNTKGVLTDLITGLHELLKMTSDNSSFSLAVRNLISQLQFNEDQRQKVFIAHAGIGLEQIAEITDLDSFKVDAVGRRITWTGAIDEPQQKILARWQKVSEFGETIENLINAVKAQTIEVQYTPELGEPVPEVPSVLDAQLTVDLATDDAATKKIQWKDLSISIEAEQLLREYIAMTSGSLLIALNEFRQQLTAMQTSVPISEFHWTPRPLQTELPHALVDHLLIGNSVIKVTGWITSNEGRALVSEKTSVDVSAIERLYIRSQRHGLREAQLTITAHRGSAAKKQSNIDASPLQLL